MKREKHPRIRMEVQEPVVACLVCSEQAASDCEDLARAFADHVVRPGENPLHRALLDRVSQVQDWVVCDECQPRLSGEDKVRLMSLWVVLEGLRNWLRTEVKLSIPPALPSAPPVQLA